MTRKQKLQVGELVVIKDYSWALRLGLDKCSNAGCYEPNARQQFKVLVTDCSIPTYKPYNEQQFADTIVMGQDDNIVWLVNSGFVQQIPPKHKIIFDGKTVELSYESFLNLKKQLM